MVRFADFLRMAVIRSSSQGGSGMSAGHQLLRPI
jgi:hypothetical protein